MNKKTKWGIIILIGAGIIGGGIYSQLPKTNDEDVYKRQGYGLVIATHFHDDPLLSGLCPNTLKASQKDRKH